MVVSTVLLERALNQALNNPDRIPNPAVRMVMNQIIGRLAVTLARADKAGAEARAKIVADLEAKLQEFGIQVQTGTSGNFVLSWNLQVLIQRIQTEVQAVIAAAKSA